MIDFRGLMTYITSRARDQISGKLHDKIENSLDHSDLPSFRHSLTDASSMLNDAATPFLCRLRRWWEETIVSILLAAVRWPFQ